MGIKVDVSKLERFQNQLKTLKTVQKETFFRQMETELANRLLYLVIPRTPVGKYPKGSGKVGGTLRRGWLNNGNSTVSVAAVQKIMGGYTITITNTTLYASYVEVGHRQTPGRYVPAIGRRLVKSWVEGQHFLKLSEQDLESVAPGILQARLDAFLRGVF